MLRRFMQILAVVAVVWLTPAYALTVKLDPAVVDLPASGGSFNVDVAIEDVSDLGGFQFDILYDPSVVRIAAADSVTLGSFLGSTGRPTLPQEPIIDNGAGKLTYLAISLPGAAGPNGSGVLATVSFTVQTRTGSQLNLDNITINNTSAETQTVDSVQGALLNASAANVGPTAHAGEDQSVQEGSAVTLDGSGSSDPDDGIETYSWVQLSGPSVSLNNAANVQASFTAPEVAEAGSTLTFQLTVTDHGGLSDNDTTAVSVSSGVGNQPPTANAGTDRSVYEGALVSLDGSGSTDPDDGVNTYSWTQTGGPAVSLSGATAAQASFTAPAVGSEGAVLTFQLTVSDHGGLFSSDSVTVTVVETGQNLPPSADAGTDRTVSEGTLVTLDGSGSSDPDDGIESYSWEQMSGPQVIILNADSAQASFTAPQTVSQATVLSFLLTVTDKGGLWNTAQVSVTVTPGGAVVSEMDGIYKDAKQTISAYVQTYTTGEILVILTPNLEQWYVFLDPNRTDGIVSVPDLGNHGHKLTMSFLANGEVLTVLVYGQGGSDSWVLERVHRSLQNSPLEDGIYKQGQEMNLYVQTYEEGSAILIFTPNAMEWSVFLDSNYSDGISVSNDLADAQYKLVMTSEGSNAYSAVVTPPSGPAGSYLFNRAFAAPKALSVK